MKWVRRFAPENWSAIVQLSQQTVAAAPDNAKNWILHAQALRNIGRLSDAIDCLHQAIARFPSDPKIREALARAYRKSGDVERAVAEGETCLRLAPDSSAMQILRLDTLVWGKQWAAAEAQAAAIERIDPANKTLLNFRVRMARRAGRNEELLRACEAVAAQRPADTDATIYKAIALARLGRLDEARHIVSPHRFVEISELATPPGYADAESFRAALTREIRSNPTLVADPRGKATTGGLQTKTLLVPGADALEALMTEIAKAVDAYERRLDGAPDAFVAARPRQASINSWAVIYNVGGQQTSHHHSDGWLSGVYYVSGTRINGAAGYGGSLVLGALDPEQDGIDPPWGTRKVEPVPGRLVMFPSFVPHATEPAAIDGERICVAFDIIPAGLNAATP